MSQFISGFENKEREYAKTLQHIIVETGDHRAVVIDRLTPKLQSGHVVKYPVTYKSGLGERRGRDNCSVCRRGFERGERF